MMARVRIFLQVGQFSRAFSASMLQIEMACISLTHQRVPGIIRWLRN